MISNRDFLLEVLANIFEYSRILNYKIPVVKKDNNHRVITALKTGCSYTVGTLLELYSSGDYTNVDDCDEVEDNCWYKVESPSSITHYYILFFSGEFKFKLESVRGMSNPTWTVSRRNYYFFPLILTTLNNVTKHKMVEFNQERALELTNLKELILSNNNVPKDVKKFMRKSRSHKYFDNDKYLII
jgi:hypothetical protein